MAVTTPKSALSRTLAKWSERTGVTAAARVKNTKSYFRRWFWSIILVVGTLLTIRSLSSVISDYMGYQVNTSLRLRKESTLDFPAVTVCNLNRVDCLRLKTAIETCEESNYTTCEFVAQPNPLQDTTDSVERVAFMGKMLYRNACEDEEEGGLLAELDNSTGTLANPLFKDLGEIEEDEDTFTELFMYFYSENRMVMGHEFSNFVRGCIFMQASCFNSSLFFHSNHPSYGNCFTFNSLLSGVVDEEGILTTALAGPKFGLRLVMLAEQEKYMGQAYSPQAGIRLAIHETNRLPLMDEFGYYVAPGGITSFSLTSVEVVRKEEPYPSECIREWSGTPYEFLVPKDTDTEKAKQGWEYHAPLCQRLCLLDSFQNKCNCTYAAFLDDDELRTNSKKMCKVSSGTDDSNCVLDVYRELEQGTAGCECNVGCNELDFEVDVSVAQYPSMAYEESARVTYGFNSTDTAMKENLLVVQVYFSTLNVREITEVPVYETWYSGSFISSLGGALSLYLGISVAMIFEVIEFLCDLILNVTKATAGYLK